MLSCFLAMITRLLAHKQSLQATMPATLAHQSSSILLPSRLGPISSALPPLQHVSDMGSSSLAVSFPRPVSSGPPKVLPRPALRSAQLLDDTLPQDISRAFISKVECPSTSLRDAYCHFGRNQTIPSRQEIIKKRRKTIKKEEN